MICRLESQKGREIPAGIVVVQITEILRQGISGLRKGDEILLCGFGLGVAKRKSARTEQVAEKVSLVVIPNEVRNPSVLETQEKRDSSARSVPRNDTFLSFSATSEAVTHKHSNIATTTLRLPRFLPQVSWLGNLADDRGGLVGRGFSHDINAEKSVRL